MNLDSTDQLLIRACLATPEESKHLYLQWRTSVVWDQIDAGTRRILPLLYQNIKDQDLQDPLLGRLNKIFLASQIKGMLQDEWISKALLELSSRSLEFIALKGFPFRSQIYGNCTAIRPMEDLDLLIHKSDFVFAKQLLTNLDLEPEFIISQSYNLRFRKEALFRGSVVNVDLHWRLLEFACNKSFHEFMWEDSESIDLRGISVRVLSPEYSLMHVMAHSVGWNPVKNIIWIVDAVRIIRTYDINWDRFEYISNLSGWYEPLSERLRLLTGFTPISISSFAKLSTKSKISSIQSSLMLSHIKTPSRLRRRTQRLFYAESLYSGEFQNLASFRTWVNVHFQAIQQILLHIQNSIIPNRKVKSK